MTDQTNTPKLPTQANFMPMALTGAAGSSVGDKVGDAIAQLVAWGIAQKCQCVPPDNVISAIHTLCVAAVVIFFYIVYYFVTKYFNQQRGVQ